MKFLFINSSTGQKVGFFDSKRDAVNFIKTAGLPASGFDLYQMSPSSRGGYVRRTASVSGAPWDPPRESDRVAT